ncbi:Hypothetical protein LUCI_5056 [Lucifera butyrica]|uniref:Uncharacterized protein n=1 Tax=Lucifera butyrica TaxID=1351585 RepID=A0A498RL21_9FIRM|nr:hypothetical protein [Lucifera butyrica]VBB09758.1 Hypothetical protein LUCI_5056 [Lucifera butyrica]
MELFSLWMVVMLILFTIWIGMVRETRLALTGYVLQMGCVLALYFAKIYFSADAAAWSGWFAMAAIRFIAIPVLIRAILSKDWWNDRNMRERFSAQFAVLVYVFLAVLGLVIGNYVFQSTLVGGALGLLLLGISIAMLKYDPSKQLFGLLSADTAADLLLIEALDRITVFPETAIYLAVLWAALSITILVNLIGWRIKEHSIYKLTSLKG